MKRLKSLIALLLCLVLLCGCGKQAQSDTQPTETVKATLPSEQTYSVTVLDAFGQPVTGGVVVNFVSGGEAVAMQLVNSQGVAEKLLPTGDYLVELGFTDGDTAYHYDAVTLTGEKTTATIVLSQALSESSVVLNAYSVALNDYKDYTAHYIVTGSTSVPLDTDDRTYVIFVPEEAGLYEFSVLDQAAVIGYYGSEHFILTDSAAENGDDYCFTYNISKGMIGTDGAGTTAMVLGLDAVTGAQCVVAITRIGDPEVTISELPWDVYENTADVTDFALPDNVTIRDFDIKAATSRYTLVKGDDGLYHLDTADGAVVYARLGCASAYMDSIENVLSNSGMYHYFYDEEGNFVRKENYTAALKEYIDCMDTVSGLYPLTDDIAYMLQSHGDYVGWWDVSNPGYLFDDSEGNPITTINAEIAWLSFCCYGETDPDDPCLGGHTEVTDAAKAPTCTETGLTQGSHCAVCGKVLIPQQTINATGHKYGSWVEIQAATADSEGKAERKCAVCGHTQQKTLDKISSGTTDPKPQKQVGTASNPDAPIELSGQQALSFDVSAKSGQYVIYHIYRLSGVNLTIENEYAYVVYNGNTYWPQNGVISVPLTSESTYEPEEIWIGNYGLEDATIHVDCLYPLGHMDNPQVLTMGSFTTALEAGNDQGYYYTFVATSKGTLTIDLNQVDSDGSCSVILYNLDSYAWVSMENNTVSVAVKAGETVRIIISLSTDNYQFPGGTVVATASFG